MTALPAVERPDGRLYRPRKIVAHPVTSDDESLTGVVVFGTHDPGRAQALADEYAAWQLGSRHAAVDPLCVWWRGSMDHGRDVWVPDETTGRAGVWFREIVERSPEHQSAAADAAEALAAAQETAPPP